MRRILQFASCWRNESEQKKNKSNIGHILFVVWNSLGRSKGFFFLLGKFSSNKQKERKSFNCLKFKLKYLSVSVQRYFSFFSTEQPSAFLVCNDIFFFLIKPILSSGISIQVVPDDTVDKSWGKGVGDNFLLVYIVLDGREQNASQKLKVGKLLHLDNLKPWIYFEKCFTKIKTTNYQKSTTWWIDMKEWKI